MNNIKLLKAKNGKGWYLNVEDVIYEAPLTALELLSIYKMIENNIKEIEAEALQS